MRKKAFNTPMSYEVSSQEKDLAEQALLVFNATKNRLRTAEDYLNIIYNPFSKSPNIDSDQIYKYRAALRRFRDNMVENFNKFKVASFKCVKIMNNFSFDTQTIKLIKSFISSIEELESIVNSFVESFGDLKKSSFSSDVISFIDKIRSKCDQINTLIDDRIKSHIKNNILSKSWVNNVGDELQIKLEKQVPIMLQLNKKEK